MAPVKVSVMLAEEDVELLRQVAGTLGVEMSTVIRHAIALEREAQRCRLSGAKLLRRDQGGVYAEYDLWTGYR